MLHLQCLLEMLPWFRAYDRTNYSRYLQVYILHMLRLSTTHCVAHDQLVYGDFATQRSTDNKFGHIPQDQTIEVTINRDTKTQDGIIGMSLNPEALFKWMILRADRAEYNVLASVRNWLALAPQVQTEHPTKMLGKGTSRMMRQQYSKLQLA